MCRYRSTRDFLVRSPFLLLVGPSVTIVFALSAWWLLYRLLAIGIWLACLALRVALRHLADRQDTAD
jgi:hypothetical protein